MLIGPVLCLIRIQTMKNCSGFDLLLIQIHAGSVKKDPYTQIIQKYINSKNT